VTPAKYTAWDNPCKTFTLLVYDLNYVYVADVPALAVDPPTYYCFGETASLTLTINTLPYANGSTILVE